HFSGTFSLFLCLFLYKYLSIARHDFPCWERSPASAARAASTSSIGDFMPFPMPGNGRSRAWRGFGRAFGASGIGGAPCWAGLGWGLAFWGLLGLQACAVFPPTPRLKDAPASGVHGAQPRVWRGSNPLLPPSDVRTAAHPYAPCCRVAERPKAGANSRPWQS